MEKTSQSNIVSFIIRFVQDQTDNDGNHSSYRGEIRHIQSDDETSFMCWGEAENFIQKFIPINRMTGS